MTLHRATPSGHGPIEVGPDGRPPATGRIELPYLSEPAPSVPAGEAMDGGEPAPSGSRVAKLARKASWNLADQVITAGTNTLLFVVLARSVSKGRLDAFTNAFYVFTLMIGIGRALVGQVLSVRFSDSEGAPWRDALRHIARALVADAPEAARATLAALASASDERLDELAAHLLDGDIAGADVTALPFVAAALQVAYTVMASRIDASRLQKLDADNACPCCGSPPVASVVRLGAAIANLRYLHCGLCNTEWNVPRAVCTHCGTDKDVALYEIEGAGSPVRAETCDGCRSYLKIVYQEKDPHVDPVADDLATLALDLLVDEAGYERAGPNLLLIGTHSG